jgi:ABC-type lipoprotein release transport system permease subunit
MRFTAAAVVLAALSVVAASAAEPDDSPPSILVSRQLAARARLTVGDVVTLAPEANGRGASRFRIVGVYEPTPDPMRFTTPRLEVQMHLPDLAAMTADASNPSARDTVNAIDVRLANAADASQFSTDLEARVPGISARSTARQTGSDPFTVLERFHVAISVVTMVGSTAFLLALMVIRAEERRETVGILRLVGISRRTLLSSVAIEGVLVAAAGALFGVALAYASEGLVNWIFERRYDTTLVFVRVTRPIALRAVAVAAPLGVVAGVGASWTLLRRNVLSIVRR